MPSFFYKAKVSPEKVICGSIEAETKSEAISKLISQGYFPISVEEHLLLDRHLLFLKKISHRDICIFTHQLYSLVSSGLPLLNALNTILGQTQNRYLKQILSDVVTKIKDGRSFSEALSNWPNIFSPLYTSMIKSAEAGGNLDEVLNRLEDYLSREQELRSNIRGALAYPFFIALVGIFTILILLSFVIPRLTVMFEDMGQILPLPTRILIGISNFLRNYGWFMIALIFIFSLILRRRLKNPQGRVILDRFKLKLPVLGEIIQKIEISRFSRTLSVLLSSGVPMISALEITGELSAISL
jgi:type II secretory pathway component PulF